MESTKNALLVNAVFSTISGFVATVFTDILAEQLQIQQVLFLRVFGVSLLLHAIALFWACRHRHIKALTKLNLFIITPYPLLVGAIVLSGHISGQSGVTLALGDALIISLFAIWQYLSLGRLANH
ncbi:MAG: hypothetical protein AB8B97_06070 [Granulosicoccus sp.]